MARYDKGGDENDTPDFGESSFLLLCLAFAINLGLADVTGVEEYWGQSQKR